MAIPQQFIQELLARTDIVEVVGQYVALKKTGANLSGLCPFHAEKTASFTVSPSKQFYHCFGCGKSGNAIGFLMDHTGAGFLEVVQDLAQRNGLQVPDDGRSAQEREQAQQARDHRQQLLDLLEQATQHYQEALKTAPEAIDYLKARGLSGRVARDFRLGWAAPRWHGLARCFGNYQDQALQEAGLVVQHDDGEQRRYDRFRGRIMFPIRNVRGQIVGLGGRILGDGKPKYLNSPETPLFHKGRELYGLHEARGVVREQGQVLVVEGYMDVVMLHQHGLANVVATLGTACTPEHVQKLFRFTDTIVFAFDGDAAGRRAAERALQAALPQARDGRQVRFLFLPPEHDPDSFVRTKGADAFRATMASAHPLSRFLLEIAASDCDLDSAEGRARFAANALPLWRQLPPGLLARQILAEVAEQAQVGLRELQALWQTVPEPARARSTPIGAPAPRARKRNQRAAPAPPGRVRGAPPARGLRALQILLSESSHWLLLSASDQQTLCELPAPLGPLFAWLEAQMHEYGAQPWSALREALRGHPAEDVALRAMEQLPDAIHPDLGELQSILRREHPRRLKQQMNAALAAGDMAGYRVLLAEWSALKSGTPGEPGRNDSGAAS